MKKSTLFGLWAGLFIICAGLGFIPSPAGVLRFLLTALSIGFFVPPAVLLYRAKQTGDGHTLQLLRNLSALSLLATMVLLALNFLSAFWPKFWGDLLHGMLVVVSSPMVCCQVWILSLLGWSVLLMTALQYLHKK